MALNDYFEGFTRRDWQTNTDGHIRIAIVGLGSFARERAMPAVRDSRFCEATVLVSSSLETATDLAEEFGVDHVLDYEKFHDGASSEAYDAVYVATPPALHEPYTETAAELGKHILCEKPLAAELGAAERMVETCMQEEVVLMTAYRLRTEPAVRRMRELIADGLIGDPIQIHGGFSSRLLDHAGPNSWRLDPAVAGGGALMDLGVYPLNTSRFLLDTDPVAVQANTTAGEPPFDQVEQHAAVQLAFPDGVTASCTASFTAHPDSRLQVLGTDGQVLITAPFGGDVSQEIIVERDGTATQYVGPPVNEVREEFDYFAHCLLTEMACETAGRDGLTDMEIIEAAYDSATTGERVSL